MLNRINAIVVCLMGPFILLDLEITANNYRIEPCPNGGPATVHLKLFSNHTKALNVYNTIIQQNLNLIWTLWGDAYTVEAYRGSEHGLLFTLGVREIVVGPKPVYNFFEFCSIVIIVEDPKKLKNEVPLIQQALFAHVTQFPFRPGGSHSVFILIRFTCSTWFYPHQNYLPYQLFWHFHNCRLYQRKPKFPQLYFCTHCETKVKMVFMQFPHSIYRRSFYKSIRQNESLSYPDVYFDNIRDLEVANSFGLRCFSLRRILERNESEFEATGFNCDFYEILRSNLVFHLKINRIITTVTQPEEFIADQSGMATFVFMHQYVYDSFFQQFMPTESHIFSSGSGYFVGCYRLWPRIFIYNYCDFESFKAVSFAFQAWWSPFSPGVWIGVLCSTIVVTLVLDLKKIKTAAYSISSFLFTFFEMLFVCITVILRQGSNVSGKVLLLFTGISTIYSSLYEIKITTELIVPKKPYVINDIQELITKGYKIGVFVIENSLSDEDYNTPVKEFKWNDYYSFLSKTPFGYKKLSQVFLFFSRYSQVFQNLTDERNKFALEYGVGVMEHKSVGTFYLLNSNGKRTLCHRTKKWKTDNSLEIRISGPLMEEIIDSLHKFRQAGLLNFWRKLHSINFSKTRVPVSDLHRVPWVYNSQSIEKTSEVITLINLVPIFSVWMGLIVCCATAFVFELRQAILKLVVQLFYDAFYHFALQYKLLKSFKLFRHL